MESNGESMKLEELIEGLGLTVGDPVCEIKGLASDSRRVREGDLFFAIQGGRHNGNDYTVDAVSRGARAVISERAPRRDLGVPCLQVSDIHRAMAAIADRFHGHPSGRLKVVGVTGTNGKTTTAHLVRSILECSGIKAGLIGTTGYILGGEVEKGLFTTPEAIEFQRMLGEIRDAGMSHAVTEVSSHALSMRRVDCTEFQVSVFTNLTRDHLDFHGDMESYYRAKRRLFSELTRAASVVNSDDPYGRRLIDEMKGSGGKRGLRMITYGLGEDAELRAIGINETVQGLNFTVMYRPEGATAVMANIASSLIGITNVYNILAAIGASVALGLQWRRIAEGVRRFRGVEGRMEPVKAGQDFLAVVDYAHTPDALRKVLETLRRITEGRIITVFGCGGDRDRGKRPQMGSAAAELSDLVVVTSDNPRTEDPEAIIKDITSGIKGDNYTVEPDRMRAIQRAVSMAGRGDVVLVAGKGHEDYQEIRGVRHPFSDREALKGAIRALRPSDPPRRRAAGYTLTEVLEATSGRLLLKGPDLFSGISIDSRTIRAGELFIALKGKRFDGHDFVDEAIRRGSGAIVNYPPLIPTRGRSIIHVNNTLKALQGIARNRRLNRQARVVGVTGTNGKTTTKEMIYTILSSSYRVLSSRGNLNNHIGLPLCLSELDDHEIAVLEMGASRPGDIRELAEIALPDIGVITNIGPAHLEGFGSLETVRSTKLELVDFVGTLVVNGDDPNIGIEPSEGRRVITFGRGEGLDVRADRIVHEEGGIRFRVLVKDGPETEIRLRVLGLFNVYNALAAISVSRLFEVPIEVVRASLEGFRGIPMRLELRELKGATVLSDLYNANPASMEEAVKELVRLKRGRAVAVLGDMLELGSYGEEAHRKLGRWLATLPVDVLIGIGELMSYAAEEFMGDNGRRISLHVKDPEEARRILLKIVKSEDTVLIKGSRGMRLERLLEG